MRSITVLLAALVLLGCAQGPRPDPIAAMEKADDEACRAQPSVPYATCRQMRMQYRAQAASAPQEPGLGDRLRNAGAALQAAGTPPPSNSIHCQYLPNGMNCF
jgi:hypothetical protein